MVVPVPKPKFNPLPGTMMLSKQDGIASWYCAFHQMSVPSPIWIVWKGDYHAACPECFSTEVGKKAKARPADTEESIIEEAEGVKTIVTCHDGACGLQTYTDQKCKVCKFAFCHKHLLKFREIMVCKECEAGLKEKTIHCQYGEGCSADSETWCEVCKKSICHFHQSSQRDYLCKSCAGDRNLN